MPPKFQQVTKLYIPSTFKRMEMVLGEIGSRNELAKERDSHLHSTTPFLPVTKRINCSESRKQAFATSDFLGMSRYVYRMGK